jgi:hypothetical protein
MGAGTAFRDTLRILPYTLDSGLRRYAILLRLQVQGRRPWRARSAGCASPLPLPVPERTTHTQFEAKRPPELLRNYQPTHPVLLRGKHLCDVTSPGVAASDRAGRSAFQPRAGRDKRKP